MVVRAQEEARTLNHGYIGTEHILLGLLREEQGVAARVLVSLGVAIERVRAHVVVIVGSGVGELPGQLPFTPRSKYVFELALREAQRRGHNHVGTEHILLAVLRENQGVAARVLLDFGADAERVRNQLIRMLRDASGRLESGTEPALARAVPAAPRASTGDTTSAEVKRLSDAELDRAIERAVDQLILEEQDFSSRRQILHANINSLRAERDRRRHDDG